MAKDAGRWRMRCSNAWNSAGACATSLHHTAGYMQATCIIWHRLQAAGPRRRPQQIMKQCSTHACLVCFAVSRWHVLVLKCFLKPVTHHTSPHSSWTRSTTTSPEAAHIEPTGSASGRTVPTKTLQTSTPSMSTRPTRGCYGDFDFAPPNLNFYAGVSGMSWKRRSV